MALSFFRSLGACVCVLYAASSAAACINDRESDKAEKEFKSRYIEQQAPGSSPTSSPSNHEENRLVSVGATVVGASLLVGAVTITVLPRRRNLGSLPRDDAR
jgi:hypothetical protein